MEIRFLYSTMDIRPLGSSDFGSSAFGSGCFDFGSDFFGFGSDFLVFGSDFLSEGLAQGRTFKLKIEFQGGGQNP